MYMWCMQCGVVRCGAVWYTQDLQSGPECPLRDLRLVMGQSTEMSKLVSMLFEHS